MDDTKLHTYFEFNDCLFVEGVASFLCIWVAAFQSLIKLYNIEQGK